MPKNPKNSIELAPQSTECSFMLTHLVRQNGECTDEEARIILEKILALKNNAKKPMLKASNVGWYGSSNTKNAKFYNPATGILDGTSEYKAVCFTESTLAGLRAHRDVFKAKYGVAFKRDWLFEHGANPCLNIRKSLLKHKVKFSSQTKHVFNFVPSQLHPFVNIIDENFDFTHEREWRMVGDMKFDIKDLLFVFCPLADFDHFSSLQEMAQPVLFDLEWLGYV